MLASGQPGVLRRTQLPQHPLSPLGSETTGLGIGPRRVHHLQQDFLPWRERGLTAQGLGIPTVTQGLVDAVAQGRPVVRTQALALKRLGSLRQGLIGGAARLNPFQGLGGQHPSFWPRRGTCSALQKTPAVSCMWSETTPKW